MSDEDVVLSVVLSIVVLILFVLYYNRIFAVTFDETFAKATGVRAEFYNMLLAFFSGLVLDAFSNTPGVATGALTATAFVQYPLMHAMVPKDAVENAVPDMNLLGKYGYISYIAILMLVHHLMYFLLEAFSFFNAMDLLLRFLGSYALSMLLALSIEMLFSSKRK